MIMIILLAIHRQSHALAKLNSRTLALPLKWWESRTEHMMTDSLPIISITSFLREANDVDLDTIMHL